MPIYKTKDENFFKKWSPEMAYVLGFIAADGSLIKNKRGSHFLDICSTDKEIIYKIRNVIKSNHKINKYQSQNNNHKLRYRIQIGSKKIFYDLFELGIKPRKSKTISFLKIPIKYLSDFIRGYFDGDGNVNFSVYKKKDRKKMATVISARFTSGSKKFLSGLLFHLRKYLKIKGGFISQKKRGGFDLIFSIKDSLKLCHSMYSKVSNNLFLKRKYIIFQKALKYWGPVV